MKCHSVWTAVAVASALIVLLSAGPGTASHDPPLTLSPFDYTTQMVAMPAQWNSMSPAYEDWAEGADLAVTLDQHLYQLMLPMVQRFAMDRGLDIAVKEGTCGVSAGMLSRKAVDMAGFCCPPGRTDRLPGLKYHTLGIGPLAIIVHASSPVENLRSDQVRALFSGGITNWAEVNSPGVQALPGQAVRPVARLHCKARPGHWRLILDNEDMFSHNLTEVGSIPDMARNVSAYSGAIGHLATWNVHRYAGQWKVKQVRVDGVYPEDSEALAAGRYPFYRAYNITTWEGGGARNQIARDLLGYLTRKAGEADSRFTMVPAARLRAAGWKFEGNELVGEPSR